MESITQFKSRRFAAALCLFLLAASPALWAEADPARLAAVSERGAKVMPFSLEKTLHQFTKTSQGGVQEVIVRDSLDSENIELIRRHLRDLSEKFAIGDFSGPESIHGPDMPGLAALKAAKPGSIGIAYADEPAGASLTYTAKSKKLVQAVHRWFDAQVRDHGHDAMVMPANCPHHKQHQSQ